MLFSSVLFLYLFLPLTLLGYYVSPRAIKNYWLLFASLVFFAWGGVSLVSVLVISILVNYFFGIVIFNNLNKPQALLWLRVGVVSNLVMLGVFKYTNFFVANLNAVFSGLSIPEVPQTHIVLPIGISFYTFHALSYLIDIYRGKTTAQRNIFDLSLYICMFSQLIAGPIIRYSDVWQQLRGRTHDAGKFASGIERFLIGLAKKVLIANTFARVADSIFAEDAASLDAANAWLGIICYSLQIYCDFAGYSDMAIGLGRMFGFDFKENFNFPYMSRSLKDFWRRWHMSLSGFFRDYLYIPLGGNRVNEKRTYLNLVIVFFLTGFWHGASWTFVAWGLLHGFFLVLERLGLENLLKKIGNPLAQLYTLLIVMMAWVLFRAESFEHAVNYWKAMMSVRPSAEQLSVFFSRMNLELMSALLIALVGSLGWFERVFLLIRNFPAKQTSWSTIILYLYHTSSVVFYSTVLFLCTLYLIAGTYNPFIYYRF